jgi:hypothetical protein
MGTDLNGKIGFVLGYLMKSRHLRMHPFRVAGTLFGHQYQFQARYALAL